MNSVLAFQRSVEMAQSSVRSGDFKRAVYNYDQALLVAPGAQDVKVWFLGVNCFKGFLIMRYLHQLQSVTKIWFFLKNDLHQSLEKGSPYIANRYFLAISLNANF